MFIENFTLNLNNQINLFINSLKIYQRKNRHKSKFHNYKEFVSIIKKEDMKSLNLIEKYASIYFLSNYSSNIKDAHLLSHSYRVGIIMGIFAQKTNLYLTNKINIENAILGGFVHDIGHLLTPKSIHMKTNELEEDERKIIKNHTLTGELMLKKISENKKDILNIVRLHHEQIDGLGYLGYKNNQIPILAKMAVIADVYDALRSKRSYKQSISQKEVLIQMTQMVENNVLDKELFQIFLTIIAKIDFLYKDNTITQAFKSLI